MAFSIATWNINSVRLRASQVEDFLRTHQPDVLCLQEIKCTNDQFPEKPFRKLGYDHQAVHGQKGYHGVAILSKTPLSEHYSHDFCSVGDTRHLSVDIGIDGQSVTVHNFYVPAGGDIPDPIKNPKFDHKLRFIEEMGHLGAETNGKPAILLGDLNIAPLENDVWSHRQMLRVVSHTPVETDGLKSVMSEGGWEDLIRAKIPAEEKVYTWWSYRAKDWAASNRGRRLDHIWSAASLAKHLTDIDILRETRGWDRASDHVPVIARFDIG